MHILIRSIANPALCRAPSCSTNNTQLSVKPSFGSGFADTVRSEYSNLLGQC